MEEEFDAKVITISGNKITVQIEEYSKGMAGRIERFLDWFFPFGLSARPSIRLPFENEQVPKTKIGEEVRLKVVSEDG